MLKFTVNFIKYLCFLLVLTCSTTKVYSQNDHHYDSLRANELYEYIDPSFPIHYVPHGDNEFVQLILDSPLHFYSEKYDQIFINTNGILTFNIDFAEYINQPLPLEYPSIAPFYANVDTTGANEATSISIFETKNLDQLSRANNLVQYAFVEKPNFEAKKLIVATWRNVGYFNARTDKLNTFQVVIIANEDESFVQFIYPEGGINWVRAETGDLGLPDIRGQAGFVAEDGRHHTLEGSGTNHVRFLSDNTNVGAAGVWLYRVGSLEYTENVQTPSNEETLTEPPALQQSCVEGSNKFCDEMASCIDKAQGFCCVCSDGYYGNGHVCLKNDSPIRIIGSLSGRINGVSVEERAKLQSYVSTADGHSYTAITPASAEYASRLRLALPLITSIGWLFAKPINGALNGYQLTGGELKHYAMLNFQTGETLIVNQTFEGLNFWDQLSVKIDIQGDVPNVSDSAELTLDDFIEEYRFLAANHLHSMQSHTLQVLNEQRGIELQMDQSIEFERCLLETDSDPTGTTVLQKVSKVVLDYSERDQAWRPSALTKIGVDPQSNACTDGTAQCGENTICKPYEDTYRCDCLHGYAPELDENGAERCVDIDECDQGTHVCDEKAWCTNNEGGFSCVCFDGYEGNGYRCLQNNTADNIQNAEEPMCNIFGNICSCSDGFEMDYEKKICRYVGKFDTATEPESRESNDHHLDECRCHNDADCHEGRCICREGFHGDGYNCQHLCKQAEEWKDGRCVPVGVPGEHEVECVFGVCVCDDGFEWDDERHICRNVGHHLDECQRCSNDADCHESRCICREGFQGDGYNCQHICKQAEEWKDGRCVPVGVPVEVPEEHEVEPICNIFGECDCSDGFELDHEKQVCRYVGNFDSENNPEDLVPCDVEPNCHPDATCDWNDPELRYTCKCNEGFYGDGYHCIKVEESCALRPEICDPNALCKYNDEIGKSECQCKRGYEGDGVRCALAPECRADNDCGRNSFCDNGVCQCESGHERDVSDNCVPAGRCGAVYCGANTLCKWDFEQQIQYCDCMEGYEGDALVGCKSLPPPCNIRNNCGVHATCEPTEDPQRYECQCNAGFHGDGYVCIEDQNCLNNPHLCDMNARCSSTNSGLVCVCNLGFYGNGSVCYERQQHDSGFLLVSQGVVIVRASLNGKNIRPISITSMAIGLDKDCLEGRVYWGDIATKKISSSKYDGTESRDFIIEDIESPEGIAIDSISRRIYWTDSVKDTIEVASLDDPSLRAVIVNKNLVNPRGIAVDPFREKLYWSDWDRESPKIEMSDLDGTGREILLGKEQVILPNSLVVLDKSGELCFADAGKKSVECIDSYTKQTRIISNELSYPFGLSFTQNVFYWTDWMTKKLESVDALGVRQKGMQASFFGSHKMFGMTAVDDQCPQMESPCQINNGGCTDSRICLVNRKAPSGKSCKCTSASTMCPSQLQYGLAT